MRALTLMIALLIATPAIAAERGFTNYDGDTLRATSRIDTPEIKGACDAERKLALRAKDFTHAWLSRGHVTIRQTGVDKYGRVSLQPKGMQFFRKIDLSRTHEVWAESPHQSRYRRSSRNALLRIHMVKPTSQLSFYVEWQIA